MNCLNRKIEGERDYRSLEFTIGPILLSFGIIKTKNGSAKKLIDYEVNKTEEIW